MTPTRRTWILAFGLLALATGAWLMSSQERSEAPMGLGLAAAPTASPEEPTAQGDLVAFVTEHGASERTGVAHSVPFSAESAQAVTGPIRMLRGQVLDASGVPVARALVALLEVDGDLKPRGSGKRALTRADEHGQFEWEVPAWARVGEVLLVARARGWQPYSEVVRLDSSPLQQAYTLTLGRGLEIWGRVVRGGLPVEGVHAWVDAKYLTSGVFGAGSEAWWAHGRLENKLGHAQTDADGIFRIQGMGAGEFRLDFGLPESSALSTVPHLFSARSGEFQVYDLSASYLLISVRDLSGPVVGAHVHVTGSAQRCSFSSTEEPTRVEVEPGGTSYIEVLLRGHERLLMPAYQAPAVGETVEVGLMLERLMRPSLIVQLPGAQATGVEWISLTLYGGELGSHGAGPAVESLHLARTPGGDEFHASVLDVEPGQYLMVMGASPQGGVSACLQTLAKPVHVPTQGPLVVGFELSLWASFEVQADVHFLAGQGGSVSMRVRDASERIVAERTTQHWVEMGWIEGGGDDAEEDTDEELEGMEMMVSMNMDGGDTGTGDMGWRFNGSWSPGASGPEGRWGLLPPGHYQLEVLAEGYKTWTGSITLVAGKHTSQSIRLSRKAKD